LEFGPKIILVDGYNIIHRTDGLRAASLQSLAAGREALLRLLDQRYRRTPHRVVVVFDGNGKTELAERYHRVEVIFTAHRELADTVIARLATTTRADGHQVVVVSDDLEVRDSVSAVGGQSAATDQLVERLYAAPKDVARRARHRQFVRRELGLDRGRDDEARPPRRAKGHRRPSYPL
jgi:predicted RNA-binding protein with PIN domain